MEFFFKKTESASGTFLIGFKLKDSEDREGSQLILKCWTQNIRGYQGVDYEVKVYQQIYQDIFSQYPYAPFSKYYMNGKCKVEQLVERIFQTGDIPDEKNNKIKLLQELTNYASQNGKYDPIPDISFMANFRVQNTTFGNYLAHYGNKKEELNLLLFIFAQIIFGLVLLKQNKISHNDLHSSNILVNDEKSVFIFDFDRSYSERIGKNPVNYTFHQQNVFDSYPRDFYKLLCYVKRHSNQMFHKLYQIVNFKADRTIDYYYNNLYVMYEKESPLRDKDPVTDRYRKGNCWFMDGELYDPANFLFLARRTFTNNLELLYELLKNYVVNQIPSNFEEKNNIQEMKKIFENIEFKQDRKEMKQNINSGIEKQKEILLQGGYPQVINLAPDILLASKSGNISDEKVNKFKKSYNSHISLSKKSSSIVDRLNIVSKVIDDIMDSEQPGLKVNNKGSSDHTSSKLQSMIDALIEKGHDGRHARILAEAHLENERKESPLKFSIPTLPPSVSSERKESPLKFSIPTLPPSVSSERKESPLKFSIPTLPPSVSSERKEKSEYSTRLQSLIDEYLKKGFKEYYARIFAEVELEGEEKDKALANRLPALIPYMNKSDEQPGFRNESSIYKSFGKDDEQPGFRNESSIKDGNKNRFEFQKSTKNNSRHTKLRNKFSSKNSSGLGTGKSKFGMVLTENMPQNNLFNRDYSKLSTTDDYSSEMQNSNKNMADLFIEGEQMSSPILESDKNLSLEKTGLSDSKLEYSYYFDLDLLVVYI